MIGESPTVSGVLSRWGSPMAFNLTAVYTDRRAGGGGVIRRIISARRSNRRERRSSDQAFTEAEDR